MAKKASKTKGWLDKNGNIWEWARANNEAGICEHWDVQHGDGRHSNIDPTGEVHHGEPCDEYF